MLVQNRVELSPDVPPFRHFHYGGEVIYMLEGELEAIAPDEERMFAERMDAETVEVASSHVAMVSHPDAVVELIVAAAERAAATAQEGATA
jgi:hypothetical protein